MKYKNLSDIELLDLPSKPRIHTDILSFSDQHGMMDYIYIKLQKAFPDINIERVSSASQLLVKLPLTHAVAYVDFLKEYKLFDRSHTATGEAAD